MAENTIPDLSRDEYKSNYDLHMEGARLLFLNFDRKAIIHKFSGKGLSCDIDYMYLNFFGVKHRIDNMGYVEFETEDGFLPADFNATMSIYDVLCHSSESAVNSCKWCSIENLKHTLASGSSRVGSGIFSQYAGDFDKIGTDSLNSACKTIGGKHTGIGDVGFSLNIFDFLPVIFQYWEGDEEFCSQIKFLWDENVTDYVHFETLYYIAGYLLSKIKSAAPS